MKTTLNILLFAFTFALTAPLSAQKYGYVNTAELIQSIPEVKEANSNIETFKNQLQKKGQDMIKSLQAKYAALEQQRDRGELSPVQLEAEAAKLQEEEAKIMQFDQESQQKILTKSENLLKPLREKIQEAIDAVATENGYTYIFDFSSGFLLYADTASDVSALVKAKLSM